jgi:GTP-binding protein LepA
MEQKYIRNFAVIAHIDHGKTTLTDRLLELTGTLSSRELSERMLDSNPIEQERGITIKLAPVTMGYRYKNQEYKLNLIDTPGHIDFNYEVERSLAACEGAILLVDATKGVQAQTLTNLRLAQKQGLKVIPIINKIDAIAADVEQTTLDLMALFPETEEFVGISAKTGQGVELVLEKVIEDIPPPSGEPEAPLRSLVFNSFFHPHLGAIAFVRVVDGQMKTEAKLALAQTKKEFAPKQLGWFAPHLTVKKELGSGEVGYIATGFKDLSELKVGETIVAAADMGRAAPLPGYREIKPHVYLDIFPEDASEYQELLTAMDKLKLNDAALKVAPAASTMLGNGLRVGFLGLLHADIIRERLEREFDLDVVTTSPSVEYRVSLTNGGQQLISQASDFPDPTQIKEVQEPISRVTVVTPPEYLGVVIQALENRRGQQIDTQYLTSAVQISYKVPLIEVITDLFDVLKSVSSGFATLDYELLEYAPVEVVKLVVLLNHQEVSGLSTLVVKTRALERAKAMAAHLKATIPRHQFEVPIQVLIGGSVVARETVKAFRKDVTAKLYGGDVTRRMKLLEKQKKGKKRMRSKGQVEIPPEAYRPPSGL